MLCPPCLACIESCSAAADLRPFLGDAEFAAWREIVSYGKRCFFCWGLFEANGPCLWCQLADKFRLELPDADPDLLNIGVGLPAPLRDFHRALAKDETARLKLTGSAQPLPDILCLARHAFRKAVEKRDGGGVTTGGRDEVTRSSVDGEGATTSGDVPGTSRVTTDPASSCSCLSSLGPVPNGRGPTEVSLVLTVSVPGEQESSSVKRRRKMTFPVADQAWSAELGWSTPPVLYSGRYVKRSRDVSQSLWRVGEGPQPAASIEQLVCGPTRAAHEATDAIFVGAGREDVDVRMLGSGRPFLIHVRNPRVREINLASLAQTINTACAPFQVEIHDLAFDTEGHDNVKTRTKQFHDYTTTKNKVYGLIVRSSRPVQLGTKQFPAPLTLSQKTPIRVLHRRAALVREKKVLELEVRQLNDTLLCARLVADAGLYVKEFVHSDLRRTQPSLSDLVMQATGATKEDLHMDLVQLDVLDLIDEPKTPK